MTSTPENKCPVCSSPVTVWADKSGGVTVNFHCTNQVCPAGKPPWDTPEPVEEEDMIECGHCGRTVPFAETSEGMCDICPDEPVEFTATPIAVYVTNPRTHKVHMVWDTEMYRDNGNRGYTLCGQAVRFNLYEVGDETMSGIAATCERCKRAYPAVTR